MKVSIILMMEKSIQYRGGSMKRKTYNNVLKAVKILMDKGYNKEMANDLAIKTFDNNRGSGIPMEYWLKKILPYEEWVKQSELLPQIGGKVR